MGSDVILILYQWLYEIDTKGSQWDPFIEVGLWWFVWDVAYTVNIMNVGEPKQAICIIVIITDQLQDKFLLLKLICNLLKFII